MSCCELMSSCDESLIGGFVHINGVFHPIISTYCVFPGLKHQTKVRVLQRSTGAGQKASEQLEQQQGDSTGATDGLQPTARAGKALEATPNHEDEDVGCIFYQVTTKEA